MSSIAYRSDIDGLRALSVIGVLFFHAGIGFPGGFVGVDVFFVISGFLITSILLKELNSGRFALADFWVRRIRRILPAVSVMVLLVLLAGLILLDPMAMCYLARSSVAQAVMLANVFFINDIGYFSDQSDYKPLLHTWSLAVEEQFYFFYPLLIVIAYRYFRKHLIPLLSAAMLLSLAFCIYTTPHDEAAAFFLLPSRAWEMLAGGLAAATYNRFTIKRSIAQVISALGMTAILIAMFFYSKSTPFPGVAAVLPVAGATALILGCKGTTTLAGRILSLSAFVFVGRISYSLYLWHWPLLAFAKNLLIEDSVSLRLLLLVLSFLLAYLSWRFVEEPFRKVGRGGGVRKQRLVAYSYGFTTCALLLAVSYTIHKSDGFPRRFQLEYQVMFDDMSWTGSDYLGQDGQVKLLGAPHVNGDDSMDFVLWGDSHGMAIAEVIDNVAKQKNLVGEANLQSGLLPVPGLWGPGWPENTKKNNLKQNEKIIQSIIDRRIPLVILVGHWASGCGGLSESEIESGEHPYKTLVTEVMDKHQKLLSPESTSISLLRQMQAMVSRLEAAGSRVCILKQVPQNDNHSTARDFYLSQYYPRLNQMCQYTITEESHRVSQRLAEIALKPRESSSVTFIDPAPLFFKDNNRLKVYDERSFYRDDDHLSRYGAKMLSPLFGKLFDSMKNERKGTVPTSSPQ